MDTEWLSVAQVAKALGISSKSVRRLIHSGRLRAKDVSTRQGARPYWRVHAAWLAEFREIIIDTEK